LWNNEINVDEQVFLFMNDAVSQIKLVIEILEQIGYDANEQDGERQEMYTVFFL
jgi:hypothetical protein